VFTSLARKLGIKGLEVVEIYDIEPWAVDHIKPRGLFFCFLWHKDNHRPGDFKDPAADRVWFANQLIDDACASQAILNVALNCPEIEIGEQLRNFRDDTETMSPVVHSHETIYIIY
jgi:ubiquitin carboxyl-terminal hydrolase L5